MKHNIQLLITALAFLALGGFLGMSLLPGSGRNTNSHCDDPEPFMLFLQQFNDDLTFQKQRTLFPLVYITPGEEPGDSTETFLIERSDWMPLAVYDSTATLIQILPMQDEQGRTDPCGYEVMIEGIHHGLQLVLRFGLQDGEWHLETFEDRSY